MSDEDEVKRRAQVAAAAYAAIVADREQRARLTVVHEAEMATGLDDLLEAIAEKVSARTRTPFLLTDDEVVCSVQTDGAVKHHILFRAELSIDLADDIDTAGWELTYRCQSSSTLDAADDFRGEDRYSVTFDDAVEFGTEAVLDGMAVLLATGQLIVDPDAVRAPPEPPAVTEHATASAQRAAPNPPSAPVPKPGMLGPVFAVLAVAFLLIWGVALLSRPAV